MVGLVLSTWKNRYLLENLKDHLNLDDRQAGGEAEPPTAAPGAVPTPYKLSQRLSSQQRAAIVWYYCGGHSSRETARQFDVGKTAVLAILRASGVKPRPPHDKLIEKINAEGI